MSMSRRCDIFKAVDGQWYIRLGDFEHAYEARDCSYYGPFHSEAEAHAELEYHSNPGAFHTDRSGAQPVPVVRRRGAASGCYNRRYWE